MPDRFGTRGTGLRGVLFDMDGTLLDSEKIWDVTLQELAARLGGRLSARARAAMTGSNLYNSVTLVHDDLGVSADPVTSGRFLLERTRFHFANGLTWRPGARDLLTAVHGAGLPAALVTSTHRDLVDIALETIGPHHFDAVVCGDEVTHNKPHPESYLAAADLLGLPPGGCVAIEDSPTGVASAETAGCVVLVVPCALPVPGGGRRVVRASLVGMTVGHLAELHASFPGPSGAQAGAQPGEQLTP